MKHVFLLFLLCAALGEDVDCEIAVSPCTASCEKAAHRTVTYITPQSGNGAPCPAATDCEPMEGACRNNCSYVLHVYDAYCGVTCPTRNDYNMDGHCNLQHKCIPLSEIEDHNVYNLCGMSSMKSDIVDPFTQKNRLFNVMLPTGYDDTKKYAVIMGMHPGGCNGAHTHAMYEPQLSKLDVIRVYPEGTRNRWPAPNTMMAWDGGEWGVNGPHDVTEKDKIDEVGYFEDIVSKLKEAYSIDESRIYMSGVSNGGGISWRLMCMSTIQIAKIAPIQGSLHNIPWDESCASHTRWKFAKGGGDYRLAYLFNETACPFEKQMATTRTFNCDRYKDNPIPILMYNSDNDSSHPSQGMVTYAKLENGAWSVDGHDNVQNPSEYILKEFYGYAGCNYGSRTETARIDDEFCMSDTSCSTNITFCKSMTGEHAEQDTNKFDFVGLAAEFFCQGNDCEAQTSGVIGLTTLLSTMLVCLWA